MSLQLNETKARINFDYGLSLLKANDPDGALEYFKEAQKIILGYLKIEKHPDIASIYHQIGLCYEQKGDFNLSISNKKKAFDLRTSIHENEHPEISESLMSLGKTYSKIDELELALYHFREALKANNKLYNSTPHPDTADSYFYIGQILLKRQSSSEALDSLKQALEIRKKLFGLKHFSIVENLYSISLAYGHLSDFEIAIGNCKKAYDINEDISGGDLMAAKCLNAIGDFYRRSKNYEKALRNIHEAYQIRTKYYKVEHADLVESLNNLAYCYDNLGDIKEAHKFKIKALEMIKKIYPKSNASKADATINVGISFMKLNEYKQSLKFLVEAYKIRVEVQKGKKHKDVAESLYLLGLIYEKLGNLEKSKGFYYESYTMRRELYSGDHRDLSDSLHSLGIIYLKLGFYKDARMYFSDALKMRNEVYPKISSEIADTLFGLGMSGAKLLDKNSTKFFTECYEIRKKLAQELRSKSNSTDKSEEIKNWNYEKVLNWFNNSEINLVIIQSLVSNRSDGRILVKLYELMKEPNESFEHTVKLSTNCSVSEQDIQKLKTSLISLFRN